MSVTPNMNLILPTVSSTPGPTYATEQNTAMTTIDAHDHTSGNGVQIPTAGLGIDADLTFAGYNATHVKSVRFENQNSALGGASDISCVYAAGGNLFFNDSSGTQIQLTAGGALNAASIGGIGGDYSTSTASVYYQSIDSTFYFTSNTNTPATINAGSVIVREPVASSNAITIKSPTSLGASYDFVLPTALPGSTRALSISSSGTLSTGQLATSQIADSAITTDKINDLAVTTGKIDALAVTGAKIANGTITAGKLAAQPYNSSGSSAGYTSTNGLSYTDPTNNTASSIATSGLRNVLVTIQPADAGTAEGFMTNTTKFFLRIVRDTDVIAIFLAESMPCISYIDPSPSAGTHSYKYQVKSLVDGTTTTINSMRITASEL